MTKVPPPFLFAALVIVGCSAGCAGRGHDLRGANLPAGRILQTTEQINVPAGTFSQEIPGVPRSIPFASQDLGVTELEIVAIDANGRPETFKESFPESWSRHVLNFDGQQEESFEDDEMAGTTILIQRTPIGWSQTLIGAFPNARQRHFLAQPFIEPGALYPPSKVAVGESWTVEGSTLARLLDLRDAVSVAGNGTFTLDRVDPAGEDARAFISYRVEITAVILDDDQAEVEVKLAGKGTIQRSLGRGLDLENKLTGQVHFSSRPSANKELPFTLAGAVNLTSSERFVGPTERHPILRKTAATEGKPAGANGV